jgi:fructokinase
MNFEMQPRLRGEDGARPMKAGTTQVVVIGEMLVDEFPSGPVVGGAPFNVARHLAAFGHEPIFVSALGEDDNGRLLRAEVDRYAMSHAGIQRTASYPTGVVEVQMDAAGSHRFVIHEDCAWDHIELAPARAAVAQTGGAAWLYAGTLALRSATSCATQLALMREHSGPRYLDINWREGHVPLDVAMEAVALANVLKANEDELAMLCNWYGCAAPESLETEALGIAARELRARLGLDLLLVTLGERGAMAIDADRVLHVAAARAVQVVDTVGAGDSFSAVALSGFLHGGELGDILRHAGEFASRICEVRGAVPPGLDTYREWMGDWKWPNGGGS